MSAMIKVTQEANLAIATATLFIQSIPPKSNQISENQIMAMDILGGAKQKLEDAGHTTCEEYLKVTYLFAKYTTSQTEAIDAMIRLAKQNHHKAYKCKAAYYLGEMFTYISKNQAKNINEKNHYKNRAITYFNIAAKIALQNKLYKKAAQAYFNTALFCIHLPLHDITKEHIEPVKKTVHIIEKHTLNMGYVETLARFTLASWQNKEGNTKEAIGNFEKVSQVCCDSLDKGDVELVEQLKKAALLTLALSKKEKEKLKLLKEANDIQSFAIVMKNYAKKHNLTVSDKTDEGRRINKAIKAFSRIENKAKKEPLCHSCQQKQACKKCGHCEKAYYCSKRCQANDWKKHKVVCRKK